MSTIQGKCVHCGFVGPLKVYPIVTDDNGDKFKPTECPSCGKRWDMPQDPAQRAKWVTDRAAGEPIPDSIMPDPYEGKDPAAVALGRRGGRKGGKARAEKMTEAERSESAKRAAKARWEGDA